MAHNSSRNTTTQPTTSVSFAEQDYLQISERLPSLYVDLHHQISTSDPLSWWHNFRAFTHIVAISMHALDDRNLHAVNYCSNTLGPLADYHALVTRLIRGLEERWRGGDDEGDGEGERVNWDSDDRVVLADGLRLAAAMDRVRSAWKKDLSVGAVVAGLRRG